MNDFVLLAIARAQAKKLVSDSLKREIVTELPTTDINPNAIYMILKTTPGQNDYYDEYMYINNQWEHIGSTEVDLTDYVKNTDYATPTAAGVVKVYESRGTAIDAWGRLSVVVATTKQIKSGNSNNRPISAGHQHEATFYGLASAAGNTDQSTSDNPVGTYTDDAKAKIATMLGIPNIVTLTQVEYDALITKDPNTYYFITEV